MMGQSEIPSLDDLGIVTMDPVMAPVIEAGLPIGFRSCEEWISALLAPHLDPIPVPSTAHPCFPAFREAARQAQLPVQIRQPPPSTLDKLLALARTAALVAGIGLGVILLLQFRR